MADHLSEEEQIESIKRWWSENWLSIVVPILLAVSAYTAWNYWNDYKSAQAAQGSEQYEVLTELLQDAGTELSEEQRNEALTIANDLKVELAGSLYGDLSALILAKLYVDDEKLAEAEATLRAVLAKPATEAIEGIAKSRLAKVLLEMGQHSDALALLSKPKSESMMSLYAEIRGDIYLDQNEIAAAHTAYQEAIDALAQDQFSHRGILQFKLEGTASGDGAQPESAEPQPKLAVETATEEASEGASE